MWQNVLHLTSKAWSIKGKIDKLKASKLKVSFAINPKIKRKKSYRLGENTNPTFNTGFICIMCKECIISVLIKQCS